MIGLLLSWPFYFSKELNLHCFTSVYSVTIDQLSLLDFLVLEVELFCWFCPSRKSCVCAFELLCCVTIYGGFSWCFPTLKVLTAENPHASVSKSSLILTFGLEVCYVPLYYVD